MTSCLPFDVAILSAMPVACGGTVTAVDADSVSLDVDRWYAGGSADRVRVSVSAGQTSVVLDGVEFIEGQRYLLTATAGLVNGCGFSGKETAQLERAFAQAFPG